MSKRVFNLIYTFITYFTDFIPQFSAPVFSPWGPSTLGVFLVYQHRCRPLDSFSLGGWRALHLCVKPPVCPGQGGHCGGTPCGRGR